MTHKKILVPTDFSSSSEAAMRAATSLARDNQAKLLIVHVEEPPLAYGAGEFYVGAAALDDTQELAEQLARVVPSDPAIEYEHRLVSGDPAREIVHLAEEEHADLIVMGTHGRTGLIRLLMGSVAESVVRHATCPVFTLRQPAEAEVES